MITEKSTSTANPTGAPPSYESITNGHAQSINEVDKKEEWPEAEASASTSAPPEPTEKAVISEHQCVESGGHTLQNILFRPGGAAAIAVTVLVALWNKKPVVCERCQKKLEEGDLQDIWERREGARRGKGREMKRWKGKGCARDGSGFYAERCGGRRQRKERPRCGRSRRNSF